MTQNLPLALLCLASSMVLGVLDTVVYYRLVIQINKSAGREMTTRDLLMFPGKLGSIHREHKLRYPESRLRGVAVFLSYSGLILFALAVETSGYSPLDRLVAIIKQRME